MKKRKGTAALCTLAAILLLGVFALPATVRADTEGDFTYRITAGQATITKYNGSAADLTIPGTLGGCLVTGIGEEAFYNCNSLERVTINNGVTIIGDSAFRECYNLEAVTIPDSVTQMGKMVFLYCTELTGVTLGNQITTIESSAFDGCTALKEIHIPDSVLSVADNAFRDVPLKTVHYGGTKEQWDKIDLGNNTVFDTVELKTTENSADPTDPSQPTDSTEPSQPAAPVNSGNTANPTQCSHTGYWIAIIALSVTLAGCIAVIALLLKKRT